MFENLNNIDIQMFLLNRESILLVAFVKYTLSQLYSYCTRNCIFLVIFGDRGISCFMTKNCSNSSYICVLILPKIAPLVLERLSLLGNSWSLKATRPLVESHFLCSINWCKNIPCHPNDWILT